MTAMIHEDAVRTGRALTDAQAEALALRLARAEATCEPVDHFSIEYPGMTILDAYAVQSAWVGAEIASGRSVKGHKVGLTSRAMQQIAGIDEPDYGVLFADTFVDDSGAVDRAKFIAPRVEVEVAFVLAAPLAGPHLTHVDVLRATSYICPSIEIIDTRFHRISPTSGKTRRITDTIADNAANAAVVLGGSPRSPEGLDLRWICGLLSKNGTIEESGVAAAVLNNPANGVAWLANKLSEHGTFLDAGEVVLAGSFTGSLPVERGDFVCADFGPLGTVSCRFA